MGGMYPLGRLITECMEHPDNRWSLRAVSDRAKALGEKLDKSTVGKLKKEMTPAITRATVYGLAAGLRVTPLTVANAVMESWGINPHPAEVTDCLQTIRIDPTLGESQRRQLIALVHEMRRSSSDKREAGSAAGVDAGTAPGIAELEIDCSDDDREEFS